MLTFLTRITTAIARRVERFRYRYDIFLSYAHGDAKGYTVRLEQDLKALDYTCFLDDEEAVPGQSLSAVLRTALERSATLVLVGSEGAMRSSYVAQEIEHFSKTGRDILPINVGGDPNSRWGPIKAADHIWIDESEEAWAAKRPSPAVVAGIEKRFRIMRRNVRVRLEWALAGAAFVVGALVAGLLLQKEVRLENEARARAETATTEAEQRKGEAERQERLAKISGARAEALRLLQLGAQQADESPLVGLRMSIEALMKSPANDAALRTTIRHQIYALAASGRLAHPFTYQSETNVVGVAADGLVLIGQRGDSTRILEARTGRTVTRFTEPITWAGETFPLIVGPGGPETPALPPGYFLLSFASGRTELRRGPGATLVTSGDLDTISCRTGPLFCLAHKNGVHELRRTADGALLDRLRARPKEVLPGPGPFTIVTFADGPPELRRTESGTLIETLATTIRPPQEWSLDHNWVLLGRNVDPPQEYAVDVRAAATGKSLPLGSTVTGAAFSPKGPSWVVEYADLPGEMRGRDGRLIAKLSGRLESRPYASRRAVAYDTVSRAATFNADGSLVFLAYEDAPGEIRNAAGARVEALRGPLNAVSLSPDASSVGLEYAPEASRPAQAADSRPPLGHIEFRDAGTGKIQYETEGAHMHFIGTRAVATFADQTDLALFDVHSQRLTSIRSDRTMRDPFETMSPHYFVTAEDGRQRMFSGDSGVELPLPAGLVGRDSQRSASGSRYVVGSELRDSRTHAVIASLSPMPYSRWTRFGPGDLTFVTCANLSRPLEALTTGDCELRRSSDGKRLLFIEGRTSFEWSRSGVAVTAGYVYRTDDGSRLAGATKIDEISTTLAIVTLDTGQEELWTTKPLRRLASLGTRVQGHILAPSGDRLLYWSWSERRATLLDLKWLEKASNVQDENDEAALLRWACAPLRTAEFFHEQDVKSLLPGIELSAACSN